MKASQEIVGISVDIKRTLVWMIVLVLAMMSSASAFDGKRRGFVLGASFGYSPKTKWRPAALQPSAEHPAHGFGYVIGAGLNEKDMIFLALEAFRHRPAILSDTLLVQAFLGPVWRHYFSDKSSSIFVSAGGGVVGMMSESYRVGGNGFGFRVGVGYSFYKHISISAVYIRGTTTSGYTDIWNSILAFRISVLAF